MNKIFLPINVCACVGKHVLDFIIMKIHVHMRLTIHLCGRLIVCPVHVCTLMI